MLALLLSGCTMGPNVETLLDELLLIAAVAEPPEVGPGEPYTLTAWIADPEGLGAEVAMWGCLTEDECLEERMALPADGVVQAPALGIAPVPVWITACADDGCDLDSRTPADLLDPTGWLDQQPLVGTAAGFRLTRITEAPAEERRLNPVILETPDEELLAEVDTEDVLSLRFVVEGAASAYGLTTAGGFGRPGWEIDSEGVVTLDWFAPEDPGPATLYVVLSDDAGATTVWTTSTEVR